MIKQGERKRGGGGRRNSFVKLSRWAGIIIIIYCSNCSLEFPHFLPSYLDENEYYEINVATRIIIFIFVYFERNFSSLFSVDDQQGIQHGCVKTSIKVLEASSLKSLFYGHPRVSKIIPRNLSGSGFVDFHFRTGSHPKLGDLNCLRWLFKSFSFLLFFYFEEKLNLTDCLSENWTSFLSSNSIIYSFFNYSWILTANKSCFFFSKFFRFSLSFHIENNPPFFFFNRHSYFLSFSFLFFLFFSCSPVLWTYNKVLPLLPFSSLSPLRLDISDFLSKIISAWTRLHSRCGSSA